MVTTSRLEIVIQEIHVNADGEEQVVEIEFPYKPGRSTREEPKRVGARLGGWRGVCAKVVWRGSLQGPSIDGLLGCGRAISRVWTGECGFCHSAFAVP